MKNIHRSLGLSEAFNNLINTFILEVCVQKRKDGKIISFNNKNDKTGRTMNRIEFVIFGAIIVYIISMAIIYFHSTTIAGYEIKMGSLFVSKTYTGFAIRDEEIVTSPYSGYVNFYVKEGERVSTRDQFYSIDESGKLAELYSNLQVDNEAYTEDDLGSLKSDIITFNHSFDKMNFSSVYNFKDDINGSIVKISTSTLVDGLEKINDTSISNLVNLCSAGKTGYVVFSTDGYEDITTDDINDTIFDQTNYEENKIENNELLNAGENVCKIITSEDWYLVIEVEEEKIDQFSFDDYMKVKFTETGDTSWAYVTRLDKDGKIYALLKFNNSCVTFCDERYVDIELVINDEKGLKIPNSSIVEKEFLVIDADYVSKGGENGNYGVTKEVYDEDGNVSYNFVDINIYSSTETQYYVDGAGLELGDYIRKPESTDGMRITETASLIGVYNINKGYADFKQINILYSNDEYSIISSTTQYGLTVYDRIVLDASTVENNDFIYYNN